MTTQTETLLDLLEAISRKIIASEALLTELDSAIGDGDCGAGMKLGFETVLARLPGLRDKSMGIILKQTGMALTSSIGGSSGALYGTAFLRMGGKVGEQNPVTALLAAQALRAALEGIKQRGEGTVTGDKTMVDALEPAVEAVEKGAAEGFGPHALARAALAAARAGSDRTIAMIARKGRASYLGERSIGHRDAGSMAIVLMFEAASEFFGKETGA